ncbi:hypothetical protein ACFO6V_23890 [Promicromonospora alba]|uniref:Restriction endonuclease n=1 Tax=Promicromonospora alba TaxID=1616110 RepID=A0ABV9HP17_9MICO
MVQIVIQPSLGNPVARKHWRDTLEAPVPLGRVRHALTPAQNEQLTRLHPADAARFWGTVSTHDARMNTVRTGDIVLFTGMKQVRGIGEVGASFRNAAVADALWSPDPDRGSYHNVYSLREFSFTEIRYEDIWTLPGFNANDNFMGTRFVTDERVDMLINALGIHRATQSEEDALDELRVVEKLVAARVVPGEALNVVETSYTREGGVTLVRRAEALLVDAYTSWAGIESKRSVTPVGPTDLFVTAGPYGGPELIEAKSSDKRSKVREAVGQLLDYSMHSPGLASLALLLPECPDVSIIRFAHAYGIDVVYAQDGAFKRMDAPTAARNTMLTLAQAEQLR